MTIRCFLDEFEQNFQLANAAKWDNVGLICGDEQREISTILICHDATEEVIEEAIENKANLIISFHPILFNALKKINNKNYVERSLMKALENKIAIYALHTAWDFNFNGVNYRIANELGLKNQHILIPQEQDLMQLEVFVPRDHVENLKSALYLAGAGQIGNYDQCSFQIEGKGQFRPLQDANPFVGKHFDLKSIDEILVKIIFEKHKKNQVLHAMRTAHPYEEVAHQLYFLENTNHFVGSGRIGELETALSETEFLKLIKDKFALPMLRHSAFTNKKIKKIGLLGGSGGSGLSAAKDQKCDAYLTGDLKYHDFFSAEKQLLLVDIGHFESEQWVVEQLYDVITKKIPKFAILKTKIKTNPVNYF